MKFNVAQALAILATTNPAVALQSTDYADNLAVVARDVVPEAATAWAPVEEAPVIEAREPRRGPANGGGYKYTGDYQRNLASNLALYDALPKGAVRGGSQKHGLQAREPRRGRPGRGGSDRLGKAVKAAEFVAAGSEAAKNVHQMVQNSKQQKRDLEAREPRRGGYKQKLRASTAVGAAFGQMLGNVQQMGLNQLADKQQPQQEQTAAAKRDLEVREPRRGRPGRGGGDLLGKAVKAAEFVGAGSQAANNVHQIVQNSKQQKRDLEAREPRRGRPGRGGSGGFGKALKAAELAAAGSETANNVHQIVQNSKQQKRDLEAREPRRGRPGRGGSGGFGKALKAAQIVAAGSETANNVHQIVQNSQQQKRDQLEAREPRRGGSGRGGSDRLGKAVKAAQFVAAGTEAAKNAHQIVQNSQQQKRDQLEAREPRRNRGRVSGPKPAKLRVAGDERLPVTTVN